MIFYHLHCSRSTLWVVTYVDDDAEMLVQRDQQVLWRHGLRRCRKAPDVKEENRSVSRMSLKQSLGRHIVKKKVQDFVGGGSGQSAKKMSALM
jgi:hypothetical protein